MRSTGHVRQRSRNSWELRYSLGTDPATGKRRTVTTTVKGTRYAAGGGKRIAAFAANA